MKEFLYNSFLLLIILFLSACSSSIRYSSKIFANGKQSESQVNNTAAAGNVFRGYASYYDDKFEGKLTSSGEIFSQSELTTAHNSLPFGTILEVTNLKNGRKTRVKVNDRGPFVQGRILDLSKAAAAELGMLKDGIAEVEIEIIQLP